MGFLASNGTIERDYHHPVETVRAAIEAVVREQGHHLGTISQDQSRFEISTKRTAMNWGTAIALTLSATGTGSHATVDYDNVSGSPKALLDGRKNTKTATQFVDNLDAKL